MEDELRDGLGLGGLDARDLVEDEVSLRRSASRRERRRPAGQIKAGGRHGPELGESLKKD